MAIEWKYVNRRSNQIGADEAANADLEMLLAPTKQKEIVADSQGRYIGQNGYTVDDLDMVGTGNYLTVTDWNKMPAGYSKVTNPYMAATPDQITERKNREQVGTNPNDITLMGDEAYNVVLNAQENWKEYTALADQAEAAGNPELAAEYRAKAANEHDIAEAERAKYGYSGGADGSQHLGLMAYTGNSGYNNVGDGSGGNRRNGYNAGSYQSEYEARINALTNAILNREAFAYDKDSDPLYQQYKESYTRGGQRGMQDTLAQVSARTGGLASSYAESAAQQTYNNFMAELADKVPELQQLAYGQYMDNIAMDRADLQMLMGLDDTAYGRWSDDRNFGYNAYRDTVSDKQWADQFAYQQAQDALAQQNWQTQWDYQVLQDELARKDALAKAQTGGKTYTPAANPTPGDEDAVISQIPADILGQLQATYPDGAMPENVWNAAVGAYGEEALAAAGFQQQQAANRELSDYQFVVKNLDEKKREGVSYKDLLYDLESALKDGLLTEAEYQNLKKRYAE